MDCRASGEREREREMTVALWRESSKCDSSIALAHKWTEYRQRLCMRHEGVYEARRYSSIHS
jgi:hypothetical protein